MSVASALSCAGVVLVEFDIDRGSVVRLQLPETIPVAASSSVAAASSPFFDRSQAASDDHSTGPSWASYFADQLIPDATEKYDFALSWLAVNRPTLQSRFACVATLCVPSPANDGSWLCAAPWVAVIIEGAMLRIIDCQCRREPLTYLIGGVSHHPLPTVPALPPGAAAARPLVPAGSPKNYASDGERPGGPGVDGDEDTTDRVAAVVKVGDASIVVVFKTSLDYERFGARIASRQVEDATAATGRSTSKDDETPPPPTAATAAAADTPPLFGLACAMTKKDASVRRGSINKGIAVLSESLDWLAVIVPVLEVAVDACCCVRGWNEAAEAIQRNIMNELLAVLNEDVLPATARLTEERHKDDLAGAVRELYLHASKPYHAKLQIDKARFYRHLVNPAAPPPTPAVLSPPTPQNVSSPVAHASPEAATTAFAPVASASLEASKRQDDDITSETPAATTTNGEEEEPAAQRRPVEETTPDRGEPAKEDEDPTAPAIVTTAPAEPSGSASEPAKDAAPNVASATNAQQASQPLELTARRGTPTPRATTPTPSASSAPALCNVPANPTGSVVVTVRAAPSEPSRAFLRVPGVVELYDSLALDVPRLMVAAALDKRIVVLGRYVVATKVSNLVAAVAMALTPFDQRTFAAKVFPYSAITNTSHFENRDSYIVGTLNPIFESTRPKKWWDLFVDLEKRQLVTTDAEILRLWENLAEPMARCGRALAAAIGQHRALGLGDNGQLELRCRRELFLMVCACVREAGSPERIETSYPLLTCRLGEGRCVAEVSKRHAQSTWADQLRAVPEDDTNALVSVLQRGLRCTTTADDVYRLLLSLVDDGGVEAVARLLFHDDQVVVLLGVALLRRIDADPLGRLCVSQLNSFLLFNFEQLKREMPDTAR